MANQKLTQVVNRDLPCKLTDAEKAELSEEMARAEIEIEDLKEQAKLLNTKKRKLEGHRNEIAHQVEDGEQKRSVVCSWQEDLPHNCTRLIRNDTGDVVEEKALTAEDLQEGLPGTEAGDVVPINKATKNPKA